LQTIESFHTHGTPPVAPDDAEPVKVDQDPIEGSVW
jgi:hypothetical protein